MNTNTIIIALLIWGSVLFPGCQNKTISISPQAIDARVGSINGTPVLQGSSILEVPDYFVWGGSVVEGDDGRFHMLYATWEAGNDWPAFSNSWVLHSKIAYAVSDYPDKNFIPQKIVLKGRTHEGDSTAWDAQMVHNPHIKKFNDRYYLYYIGARDPGVQPAGSQGAGLNKRNRVQQSQHIGVIEFDSFKDLLQGKFNRPKQPLLSPRTRVKKDNVVNPSPPGTIAKPDNLIVVNPSVVYRPNDKKYLLYFKGNIYDPNWRGVHGVAISDSPTGPFQPLDNHVFDMRTEDGKIASAEDPYVWYHKGNKCFYAVFKDFSGKITGQEPGLAMLQSVDGIKWEKPGNALFMKKELTLSNGEKVKVDRLERPQILVDENGNPQAVYLASSIEPANKKTDGTTFNVQVSLRMKK
ncbi:glycoside hydrolase family protein [Flexithrix dorotheae]|uniref:glycoside hydrolase family protein n=1 Tax=Flexithrix dorotheae TaxID=70993 RepID=UPI0003642EBB|nr:glycoside hydrolase family protein [Flexithrix dorotheae]